MMIVGGNGKCRAFFREMDIERLNIKDKYKTKAAAWYRDYLKNLAEGGGTGGPRPSLEEAKQPMELAYGAAPASSSSSHSSFDRYGSTPAGGEFSSSSSSSMGPGSRAATMNGRGRSSWAAGGGRRGRWRQRQRPWRRQRPLECSARVHILSRGNCEGGLLECGGGAADGECEGRGEDECRLGRGQGQGRV
eukprot:GHVU01129844.1.p1 GENE.GHVU01129844.1~~GHVU01129844.1.p1  ORF type:complete len:191 (-),score=39.82 GHVU01129844.1:693-1265(-)